MSANDWTLLEGSLEVADCDRGVTAGIARPNGGGDFVFGLNSLTLTSGVVAFCANQAGFSPLASGGTIRGAIRRGKSAGSQNYAPFFFAGLQGTSVDDVAYILGLADDDPYHIVLKKGALSSGLEDEAPTEDATTILLRSTKVYTEGEWLHLRLDVIRQGSGDVLLQVFENDLSQHPVTQPAWHIVAGMEGAFVPSFNGFVDDALGVNTGSNPLIGGRIGYGFYTSDVQRRGYFDQIQVGRQ